MGLKIDKKYSLIPKILGWAILAILVILMAKILIWENSYYKTKSAETRATQTPVLSMVEHVAHPDETELSDEQYSSYQVTTDAPRYLKIERLGVDTIIEQSESANTDILAVPHNIYQSMWYSGSSRPGQGRTIIITGLSAGDTKDGIFKNLSSLEKGDEIKITNGNNFEYTYEVEEISLIQEKDMSIKLNDIQSQIDNQETLSLVTTNIINSQGLYESVGVVRATLKSSTELTQ